MAISIRDPLLGLIPRDTLTPAAETGAPEIPPGPSDVADPDRVKSWCFTQCRAPASVCGHSCAPATAARSRWRSKAETYSAGCDLDAAAQRGNSVTAGDVLVRNCPRPRRGGPGSIEGRPVAIEARSARSERKARVARGARHGWRNPDQCSTARRKSWVQRRVFIARRTLATKSRSTAAAARAPLSARPGGERTPLRASMPCRCRLSAQPQPRLTA